MLHLAICDKSLNDIEQMEKYLENIKFFNFDYEVFENAKELYKYQTQRKRLNFRYDRKNPRLLSSSRSTLTIHI